MKNVFVFIVGLSMFFVKTKSATVAPLAASAFPVEIKDNNASAAMGEKPVKTYNVTRFYQINTYINRYKPLADSLSAEYGIPSSVILGVAIIESGAGRDRNPRLMNNHFGVVGKNNLMKTCHIKTMYKQYASAEDSYIDFCKIISRKRYYSELKGNTDYAAWVAAISGGGYSDAPKKWEELVLSAIRDYKLDFI